MVRNISELLNRTQSQIEGVKMTGIVNYFGKQRFGARQYNIESANRTFINDRLTMKFSANMSMTASALGNCFILDNAFDP